MKPILIFFCLFFGSVSMSMGQENGNSISGFNQSIERIEQPKKLTVLATTLLLGPLGGHRVLLGTKSYVPIVYTLTLGGLGILPLIDFFVTLFSKDLKKYQDSAAVLMWLNQQQ